MAKEWERWQSTILDLYKVQKKTLAEVMRIMDKEHGFKASCVHHHFPSPTYTSFVILL